MRLATGNGYIVNGTTNLEELEDLFHIEFPKEDIDTVNGFMLYEYGKLPENQEKVKIVYQGFLFEAMEYDEHMISKVRIRKLQESVETDENND